jgi:hydroxymethylpyrimidine pyrophosphatase-like HAD family hydrolase
MRFGVLALDYDGTIALDGVLDPDVRRAIGEARSCGIVVPIVLRELVKEGIPFSVGQCVVEADATSAHEILTLIQRLELPLVLLFNRGRLMVLPQAVSKSVGLRAALSVLRLSVHNAIAIGDAENDHDLLRACEVGVARRQNKNPVAARRNCRR